VSAAPPFPDPEEAWGIDNGIGCRLRDRRRRSGDRRAKHVGNRRRQGALRITQPADDTVLSPLPGPAPGASSGSTRIAAWGRYFTGSYNLAGAVRFCAAGRPRWVAPGFAAHIPAGRRQQRDVLHQPLPLRIDSTKIIGTRMLRPTIPTCPARET